MELGPRAKKPNNISLTESPGKAAGDGFQAPSELEAERGGLGDGLCLFCPLSDVLGGVSAGQKGELQSPREEAFDSTGEVRLEYGFHGVLL